MECALLLLSATALAWGQSPRRCDPGSLANAANVQHTHYEALISSRGLSGRVGRVGVPVLDSTFPTKYGDLLDLQFGVPFASVTAVLFYAADTTGITVWLLGNKGLIACGRSAVKLSSLDSAVDLLHVALRDPAAGARLTRRRGVQSDDYSKPPRLDSIVAVVSDLLLPLPIRHDLRSYSHLIIVPAGAIGTVPFGILRPSGVARQLIDRLAVTIAPSLWGALHTASDWQPADSSAVLVGDPAVAHDSTWAFPPLPGARAEVRAIQADLHAPALYGRDATPDSVLKLVSAGNVRILYIAAHGFSDAQSPLDGSFLALAPGRGSGRWTARQIQSAEMKSVQLAILSACETGLGKPLDGGMVGLARAFNLAGVPRVVMSLWDVDDKATTAFMTDFVHRLKQGTPPSRALRETALATRARDSDPRHWAAFALFGDSQ